MVARSHRGHILIAPKEIHPLPDDRRGRCWLGCAAERDYNDGNVDEQIDEMALEQERAIRSICSNTETSGLAEKCAYSSPIRQSDSGSLHPQRGRDEITESSGFNMQVVDACRLNIRLSAHYLPGRYNCIADHLSRGRRLPEWHLLPAATRQVFSSWGTPHVDLFASAETAVVRDCLIRLQRSLSFLLKRLQSPMAFSAGVDISSAQPDTQSIGPLEQCQGSVYNNSTSMGGDLLDGTPEVTCPEGTNNDREVPRGTNRCDDRHATSANRPIDPSGLVSWGWGDLIKNWSPAERQLLNSGWG